MSVNLFWDPRLTTGSKDTGMDPLPHKGPTATWERLHVSSRVWSVQYSVVGARAGEHASTLEQRGGEACLQHRVIEWVPLNHLEGADWTKFTGHGFVTFYPIFHSVALSCFKKCYGLFQMPSLIPYPLIEEQELLKRVTIVAIHRKFWHKWLLCKFLQWWQFWFNSTQISDFKLEEWEMGGGDPRKELSKVKWIAGPE